MNWVENMQLFCFFFEAQNLRIAGLYKGFETKKKDKRAIRNVQFVYKQCLTHGLK